MIDSATANNDTLKHILSVTEKFNHIHDIDSLLDEILSEARAITHADAGSIYLVENGKLVFRYVQNDSLFKGNQNSKFIYSSHSVPEDETSIAGYAAIKKETVVIDDVYKITRRYPFKFNKSFDETSNYRTKSILAIPLITSKDKAVGVLQIINALDEKKESVPFPENDQLYASYLANSAAVAIERAIMTRETVLRMIKMSELRDPKETGAHVNRVGAYSAEIYQKWAEGQSMGSDEIRRGKDIIRISAMTHDVGKIAIPDAILKKPAQLTNDEFTIMQYHSIYGGQLFAGSDSELDQASHDIALNHHEKWDGKGYPGKITDIHADHVRFGEGKRQEEIPLYGRIVALADVYDALISKRVYKDAWDEDKVLQYIRDMSGKHFDPAVVEAFDAITGIIDAIREKFVG